MGPLYRLKYKASGFNAGNILIGMEPLGYTQYGAPVVGIFDLSLHFIDQNSTLQLSVAGVQYAIEEFYVSASRWELRRNYEFVFRLHFPSHKATGG